MNSRENPFFTKAMAAAKKGPSELRKVFQLPEADANICSHGKDRGESLIHAMFHEFEDADLPPLFAVLVENNVNLNTVNFHSVSVLAQALAYLKINTMTFLLANNTKFDEGKYPALHTIVGLYDRDVEKRNARLSIAKLLIETHNADIDALDGMGRSALDNATNQGFLEAINYLLTLSPKLITEHTSALLCAYVEFEALKERGPTLVPGLSCVPGPYDPIHYPNFEAEKRRRAACFESLLKATTQYFYKQFAQLHDSETSLPPLINLLLAQFVEKRADYIGNYAGNYLTSLRNKLMVEVVEPMIKKTAKERAQRKIVCMGALLPTNNKSVPIYNFFRSKLFSQELLAEMFSYAQEVVPQPVHQESNSKRVKR